MTVPNTSPKVALIHDYLIQYGGAEKTLEAIAEIFPTAPIYTGVYKPEKLSPYITSKNIIAPKNFFIKNFTKYASFLMPLIFESFDLRQYDIIISDTSCWAKGVLTNPDQLHISYNHTPPRFLYGYSVETTKRNAWYYKPFVKIIDSYLRVWDFSAAQRPNFLLVNSQEVLKRVQKFYKRDATVIYPPVEVFFDANATTEVKTGFGDTPYYVAIGRLVAYKNFELIIEAFNKTGSHLAIIGTGQEEKKLKKLANANVHFLGQLNDKDKHVILDNSLGLINAVEDEDFGIVPLEAMAHGKPVLVHRSGGALETIEENVTGMFFNDITLPSLEASLKAFDQAIKENKFDQEKLKASVTKFSKERFKKEFETLIMEKWKEKTTNAGTTRSNNNS